MSHPLDGSVVKGWNKRKQNPLEGKNARNMTTAIKSVNSVLLQTLACILSLFSSLFSVPSVLASYAPRLLLDAVSFLGTWLTGHLHLGRWCRFLKFSNSSDPFLWGRDRHSCLFLTSALICHWFFVCVSSIAAFLFTLCHCFVCGLVNLLLFTGFRTRHSFLLLTEGDELLAWSFDMNLALWYKWCRCLWSTHVGHRSYTAAVQNDVWRSAGRNSPGLPKSKPRLCGGTKTGETLITAEES